MSWYVTMQDKIIIKGAREHNLKNINLEIPRNKMIVFTGLSGSGKSSLAFDTIFAEGQRRYVESLSAYARQFLGQMQKPDVDEIEGLSPAISIDQKAHGANPRSTVATITEIYDYLRVLFARVGTPYCPDCGTKINRMTVEEMVDQIITRENGKEIKILSPVVMGRKGEYYQMLYDFYHDGFMEVRVDGKMKSLKDRIILTKYKKHSIDVVIDSVVVGTKTDERQRLSEAVETAVDLSNGLCIIVEPGKEDQVMSTKYSCPKCGFSFPEIEPRLFSFNSPYGYCTYCNGLGTKELFSEEVCPECDGKRLNKNALSVRIDKKNIFEITQMSVAEAFLFITELSESKKLKPKQLEISEAVLREVNNRIKFMSNVGLDYITLNRKAGTLSGGEAQRIRLASQVGTNLVGALYVLDEPTIGLHQRDNALLVNTLTKLRDMGNTIIVVEHDEETIMASDWVVDIGPRAGVHGGEIVASEPLEKFLKNKKSLTAQYLRGEKKIPVPTKRRNVDKDGQKIQIKGAKEHNLKNINIDIPLRRFVGITGVSGSGKSTLMYDVLYKAVANKLHRTTYTVGEHKEIKGLDHIDKILLIDQSPIGRTSRSNPATYTKTFDEIRDLFAATTEARVRGYKKGRFSFNRPGGRCENCEGKGELEIEMHFLPSVHVMCDVCKGKRFDRETLEVHYKGKNISDVLNMTTEEAEQFFRDIPPIYDKLKILNEIGLEYLTLGQPATTLSGGEAQRIKLSKELAKRSTSKTLYLLDEPTTGLHYDDIAKLLHVLNELVNRGNTVVVIEHNLDVIKQADWLIDLGPEGGDKGGELVCAGTPEDVARYVGSYTGYYLKKVLKK